MNKIKYYLLSLILIICLLCPTFSGAFNLELLEQDVEELSARLDEVEKQTLLDKIKIGAEIRTRSDWFRFVDHNNSIDDGTNLLSTRFRLNMKADVSDNLQFHARLSMLKNWVDDDLPTYPMWRDFNYSRARSDANLKVERAYMDYFFDILPIAVTIGRFPVADGLPTDLRENTPRKSTYPCMAFDVEADGAAISLLLDRWIPMPNMALKFLYTQFTIDDDLFLFRDDTQATKSMDIYVGQFETGFPAIFKNTTFIFNYLYAPDVSSPHQLFADNVIAPKIAENAGVPTSSIVMDPSVSTLPSSLGSMYKYTLLLECKNFLNSWFDVFGCYGHMRINPDGPPAIWVGNITITPGGTVSVPVGLLSGNNNNETKHSECIYYGVRVNIPLEILDKNLSIYSPKFGYEYNKGSRYWIGTSWASEDPLDKLSTRGQAIDFYYIQPIDKHFFIRVGYTEIDYDFDNSGNFYETNPKPAQVKRTITNTYVLLDMKF